MKIKLKITLGVGLLFMLIILLATLGTYYINEMNKDTQNILVANYNTLNYSRNMLIAIDEDITKTTTQEKFLSNLEKQKMNISEIGERELTDKLSADFESLKKNQNNNDIYKIIRKDLTDIMVLNMQAIERKSNVAKHTANTAILWIAIIGTICFLIAFTLLVNLPNNIANPIKELSESIKQIAAKNYKERVNFEEHNEFGALAKSFNTMASKLEEYNNSNLAKLMTEKTRIETLINIMHDPVIGLDENKKIIFANTEVLKVAGLKAEQIIGKNASDLSIHNDLVRFLLQEISIKENLSEKIQKKPLKIFADNKESYFEKEVLNIDIIPTGEKENKLIGHVVILRNVTEYKELDVAKTNFIATVSHELKTPISSIKMSVQLLENEKIGVMNDEQKNLIDSIKDDSTRLLKITGELLNMTQVESGNIQLGIIPTDPFEILNYAVNTNKMIAEQKHIKLEIDCPKNLSKVLADSEKTAWVLTNLISNAIRYSYDNSTVFIAVNQHLSNINFIVKDTGQGIEPKYKDKIFDRYFRIPGSNKEGTGLGLSISKEFIEAQGGQIKVESDFGAGSTFTVTLNAQS
jgi:NtrC-family two-component system sensor histidine kinase KinB